MKNNPKPEKQIMGDFLYELDFKFSGDVLSVAKNQPRTRWRAHIKSFPIHYESESQGECM